MAQRESPCFGQRIEPSVELQVGLLTNPKLLGFVVELSLQGIEFGPKAGIPLVQTHSLIGHSKLSRWYPEKQVAHLSSSWSSHKVLPSVESTVGLFKRPKLFGFVVALLFADMVLGPRAPIPLTHRHSLTGHLKLSRW